MLGLDLRSEDLRETVEDAGDEVEVDGRLDPGKAIGVLLTRATSGSGFKGVGEGSGVSAEGMK